ncbi:MAG: TVP38/TMEM64 family protein, partial [Syntrophobacterales bacterium]
EEVRQSGKHGLLRLGLILLALIGLSAAWRWTPLGEWLSLERISGWIDHLRGSPSAPFIILGGYIVGSLVLVPVTLMILATAFAFGPLAGAVYSLVGCLMAAALTYALGHILGRDKVRRLAGSRLDRVNRRIADHGLVSILTVRLLPVAPYTVVNIVAGASHIGFRDFVFGTILGMAPGILAITVFERQLEVAIREPGAGSITLLALVAAAIFAIAIIIRKRLGDS